MQLPTNNAGSPILLTDPRTVLHTKDKTARETYEVGEEYSFQQLISTSTVEITRNGIKIADVDMDSLEHPRHDDYKCYSKFKSWIRSNIVILLIESIGVETVIWHDLSTSESEI